MAILNSTAAIVGIIGLYLLHAWVTDPIQYTLCYTGTAQSYYTRFLVCWASIAHRRRRDEEAFFPFSSSPLPFNRGRKGGLQQMCVNPVTHFPAGHGLLAERDDDAILLVIKGKPNH